MIGRRHPVTPHWRSCLVPLPFTPVVDSDPSRPSAPKPAFRPASPPSGPARPAGTVPAPTERAKPPRVQSPPAFDRRPTEDAGGGGSRTGTAQGGRNPWRWAVLGLALLGYVVVHMVLAGHLLEQVNVTDREIRGGDQKHNMRLALQTRADLQPDFDDGITAALQRFVPHRTDGVVNPLWPWIAAWLADPEQEISPFERVTAEDREFFNRGRWFHVGLTAGFLLALGLAAGRVFSLPSTINLVLLGGLGALLPRATYFQPEPLFYIFFFLTWVGCLLLLRSNPLWLYLVTGLCAGIAYMAKGAVTPLLLAFVAVTGYRFVVGVLLPAHLGGGLHRVGSPFSWRNHFLGLLLVALAFAVVSGPRLHYSAERYGDPFHSYPSYWMWMDDFEQGYAWMMNHNNAETLGALTADDKPSARNYLRERPWSDVTGRLADGTWAKTGELLWPRTTTRRADGPRPWKRLLDHRGWYLGGLLAVLAVAALMLRLTPRAPEAGREPMEGDAGVMIIFVLGSAALYALAYGWYDPIGRGDRFMLSLYLPLAFSLIYGFEVLLNRMRRRRATRWPGAVALSAQWLLTAVLVWRVVELLRWPTFDGA